jgi:hypothetical protein
MSNKDEDISPMATPVQFMPIFKAPAVPKMPKNTKEEVQRYVATVSAYANDVTAELEKTRWSWRVSEDSENRTRDKLIKCNEYAIQKTRELSSVQVELDMKHEELAVLAGLKMDFEDAQAEIRDLKQIRKANEAKQTELEGQINFLFKEAQDTREQLHREEEYHALTKIKLQEALEANMDRKEYDRGNLELLAALDEEKSMNANLRRDLEQANVEIGHLKRTRSQSEKTEDEKTPPLGQWTCQWPPSHCDVL